MADFPKQVTVDQIVDTLSGYALEEKIKILSYSPTLTEDHTYVKVNSFTISILAENYQRMLSFVKTIENSPYALRLESWSAEYFQENEGLSRRSINARRHNMLSGEEAAAEVKDGVRAEIKLSLIELKT